jgi:hypothetical protein
MDCAPRFSIPNNGRFPLIGDADRGDACVPVVCQYRPANAYRGSPNFLGIVFHPAVPREILREFLLRRLHDGTGVVEQNRPRRGGSLIDCE